MSTLTLRHPLVPVALLLALVLTACIQAPGMPDWIEPDADAGDGAADVVTDALPDLPDLPDGVGKDLDALDLPEVPEVDALETTDALDAADQADGSDVPDAPDVPDIAPDTTCGATDACLLADHPDVTLKGCQRLEWSELACACVVVNRPVKEPCDDQNACTLGDFCLENGKCAGVPVTPAVFCDDGQGCTHDTCDKTAGCVHAPNALACTDGNACTVGDVCAEGQCLPGAYDAVCSASCAARPQDWCETEWGDDNRCNGVLTCTLGGATDGQCAVDPDSVVACDADADTACTRATCNPATGQCAPLPLPDLTPCDDGDACTSGDACQAGTCQPGPADDTACDDDNPCTDDSCDPQKGCQHAPTTAPCDDGNACTTDDTCDDGACAGTSYDPLVCPPCDPADDTCEAQHGDGKPCTGLLVCVVDRCQVDPLSVPLCAPGADPCTRSRCSDARGGTCQPQAQPDGQPCNDADPCTVGDQCQDGACAGTPTVGLAGCECALPADCADDGDPCTTATCDPATHACGHVPAPRPDVPEACNGVDDDCDGATDEDLVASPTTCGTGACAATGESTCVQGVPGDSCVPGTAPEPLDTTCDGVDGDCDGQTDEEFAPATTTCGTGACASTGETFCQDQHAQDTCTPGQPGTETCNGVDDDCDDQVDEGFTYDGVPLNASCDGRGLCSTGTVECKGPSEATCSTNPGGSASEAEAETCNNADDDCDGVKDNGADLCLPGHACVDGACTPTNTDGDADGWFDAVDNCPDHSNADQADQDGDSLGDACDPDQDGDGWTNDQDDCPVAANADQADTDGDGLGDACDGCRPGAPACDVHATCTARQGPDNCVCNPGWTPVGKICTCTPACAGKACGDDGCGGSCGTCTEGALCLNGACSTGLTPGFVYVPAGSFWMGSPGGEPCPEGYTGGGCPESGAAAEELGRNASESLHYVTLTIAFESMAKEVTQDEFHATLGYQPSLHEACGGACPVENLSWHEALAYANARSVAAGLNPCFACTGTLPDVTCSLDPAYARPQDCPGYRLPTESEWEYAYRAGSVTALYPSNGNDGSLAASDCTADPNLSQIGWYCGTSPTSPRTGGQLEANALGLFDMAGNVWELCWDIYATAEPYYPAGSLTSPLVDPSGLQTGTIRVFRGGCHADQAARARAANRGGQPGDFRSGCLGFRLVRSLPEASDLDNDGDPDATDCAPLDSGRGHGLAETCDGADNDCDGATDEGFADTDGDSLKDCADPDDDNDGDADPTDCAPVDADVHHGATETCNTVDDDCDGLTDEGDDLCLPDDVCVTGACVWNGATCSGVPCPVLDGYTLACNAEGACQLSNADGTGWRAYDVWLFVPEGSYPIGSPTSEDGHTVAEIPVHTVTLAGFLVAKYELATRAYEACVADGACSTATTAYYDGDGWGVNTVAKDRADHPQNGLTWDQATTACAWLHGRLPSEAEWEAAAAGPVHRVFPWGDTPLPSCANDTAVYDDDGATGRPWGCDPCNAAGCSGTWPLGSKPAGASWCGALDMAGNVYEWVADLAHATYDGAPTTGEPWLLNPDSPTVRGMRGGSYRNGPFNLRSSSRASYSATRANATLGARCARDLPGPDGDGVPADGDRSGTPGDAPCHGGATAWCDDNCPAVPNPTQADLDNDGTGDACDADADGDGASSAAQGGPDCDDHDATVKPGAGELCNGKDDDCDGKTDADDADLNAGPNPQLCEKQVGACAGVAKDGSLCVDGAWAACDDLTYALESSDYEPHPEVSLDGVDNDCDALTDEGLDVDHDGVCIGCTTWADDTCPTVWNPDNDPSLCTALGTGWAATRALTLAEPGSADGTSTWRRSNEPVEIPLWNGILDDSVVGYWTLNGGAAVDLSGNWNEGVATGVTAGTGAFGDPGGALDFAGSGSVLIEHLPEYEIATGTVSFWFKAASLGALQVLLAQEAVGNNDGDLDVKVLDDGRLAFELEGGGTTVSQLNSAGRVDDSSWHHVAGTWGPRGMALFLDGRLVTTARSSLLDTVGNANPISLGTFSVYSPLVGALDEVLLFRRNLSPDEIQAYAQSRKPYGTSLVPGAQVDFDDVRVTETAPTVQGAETAHTVPIEILGPRPHSDTPCPMGSDDGTWKDRDDLCGVVGYWRLDGNATDASGNGHDGTIVGAIADDGRFGDANGAILLDGTSDYVDAGDSPDFKLTTVMTIEAWIWLDHMPTAEHALIAGRIEGSGYDLSVETDGFVRFGVHNGSGFVKAASPVAVTPRTWTHVAGVLNAGGVVVYENGLRGTSVAFTGTATNPSTVSFLIGANSHAGNLTDEWFPGRVDDVLIHNVAKSPDYLYRRANPGVPTVRFLAHTAPAADGNGRYAWQDYALAWAAPTATHVAPVLTAPDKVTKSIGLLSPALGYAGWWRFNEGSGTVAFDETTWRHEASFAGTPGWVGGRNGTALEMDGVADRGWIYGTGGSFDLSSFDVEVAFRATSVTSAATRWLVHKGVIDDPDNSNFAVDLSSSGTVAAFYEYGSGTNDSVYSASPIEAATWTTAAFTHETGLSKLYVDGIEEARRVTAAEPALNTWPIYIGVSRRPVADGWQEYFAGAIDDIRLMSRALTPDELLHYPMAAWTAGPASGTALVDSGDGTVFDLATGLIWQKTPPIGKNWIDANDYCNNNQAGLPGTGWHLPSISELRSLLRGCSGTVTGGACGVTDACLAGSCWSAATCDNCTMAGGPDGGCYWDSSQTGSCAYYWSGSTLQDSTGRAWWINFNAGGVYGGYKTDAAAVRCVRTGP